MSDGSDEDDVPLSDEADAGTPDDPDEGRPGVDPPSVPAEDDESRRRSRLLIAGLTAVLIAPLGVALVVLRNPRWFPILDIAMTELRVRDTGTSNTPLIGLPGRIGQYPKQGSHPGPLSFWLLAPVYRLFGGTSSAIAVSTVVLHTAAVGLALWLAKRRGGIALVLGTAVVLSLLIRSYGAEYLTQPWNPYMPLLLWFVALLAVWSVLCRDAVALPVFVFAGSFCAQTHTPYLGMVGGVGLLVVAGIVLTYRSADADGRRRLLKWTAGSVALGVVLWTAPVVDQFISEPGNFGVLFEHFGTPPEESIGFGQGLELTLLHLNLWRFVTEQGAAIGSLFGADKSAPGSTLPGLLTLGVWLASVAVARKLGHQRLLRLHAVVGVGLVFSVISISRIFGQVWYYLMLWAWGVTALLLLAVGWTAVAAYLERRAADRPDPMLVRAGVGGALALIVLSTAVFAVDASDTEPPAKPLSTTMETIVPATVQELSDGSQEYRGRDERYLVNWSDLLYIGAQGVALVNELDRAGFDIGVIGPWSTVSGRHRERTVDESTSYIHMANGVEVDVWRKKPGMVEIAYVEPRTPAEIERFEEVRLDVRAELKRHGLEDLYESVDRNLFAAAIDPRITSKAQDGMDEMGDLGLPTAVFVGPPSVLD